LRSQETINIANTVNRVGLQGSGLWKTALIELADLGKTTAPQCLKNYSVNLAG
jgi:hypothetical protein